MSSGMASVALAAYRWASVVVYPLTGPFLAVRAAKGKEDRARRAERYGYASLPRPVGPLAWVHAASVGETLAVVPLLKELRRREINVLLTTGTVTSAELVKTRLSDDIMHQYVPLDVKPAIKRFLRYWRPDLAISVESEIWPVTMIELQRRHVPQILVNARISDRSFERWRNHASISEALFGKLALVVAQSDLDAERYRDLGAWPVTIAGNIKVDAEAPACDAALVERYRQQIGRRKSWAAISTFEGEEKVALMVHRALKAHTGLLTIVVPRHPERADDLEKMMLEKGFKIARRSRGDVVTDDTDILLGDTIGEMGLYLRLTEVAFVGRSLTAEGGQNPLEPAMLGTAVLSGPHVQNFRDSYQKLVRCGAARIVRDPEMLAKAVHFLNTNDLARHKMMDAGTECLQDMRGALAATMKGLEPFINPLTVKARLQPKVAS
ncbi:lipid IV(A) 3-deoxy-D-manno-octulosonic acid transferase [Ciceribacter sp. L1K23]|uniref:lipid IV(A) 3-deoxy-D-manno-octulosonic acid transferase n=1 Tax=unclassified Ciceribacter TaxID=2628820 RepID=UPI001ABE26B3|nr:MULTISPECIES: lipid IV(A) 3-deoxy-D-manno-octulosonic acid transferase [unclassified Ciceribacter]MBO3759043.1 lipid IV(A) 3-deoxy-D-manno-octulosonic acid transferase [Ciceribacter sp. L1K22]MBR0556810.1 lipid IV(A) 3-deoxy-D-manno-octulosonic acid transferase [Ciceribacter sp. L1K23]